MPDPNCRTFWSAVANANYIVRQDGEDLFGPTIFSTRLVACPDLVDHGRRGPIGCDADAVAGIALWQATDRAAQTDRPRHPAAFHAIGWLPTDGDPASWRELVLEFLDEQIVRNGMIADWAIHALADDAGGWSKRPHLHAVITARFWRRERRQGEPQPAWSFTPKRMAQLAQLWEEISGRSGGG